MTTIGAGEEGRHAAPEAGDTIPWGFGFAWVIIELAPDGILVSDDDGRIVMANRQLAELFGYDRHALVGASVDSLVPSRLRARHESHRASYSAAPSLRPMGSGPRLFGCRADGSEFPIEVSLSPALTELGVGTVAVVRSMRSGGELDRAARVDALAEADGRAGELYGAVINDLVSSELSIAGALRQPALDDAVAVLLKSAIGALDRAIEQLRDAAYATMPERPDLETAPRPD